MTVKRIYRKLGRDGKYKSLIGSRIVTISSDQTTEERKKAFAMLSSGRTVLDDIELFESYAKEHLEANGFPSDYPGPYEYEECGRKVTANLEWYVQHLLIRAGKGDEYEVKLEPEYRAANMLFHAVAAKAAIKKTDTESAVHHALRLVEENYLLLFSGFEREIRVGQVQLEAATRGGEKYPEQEAVWLEIAARHIAESRKRPSNRCLTREVISELRKRRLPIPSFETARKVINKHYPNPRNIG